VGDAVDESYSRGDESEAERLDRNYGELLQELRVAQTGVQVLFAFLLGIAFTNRFTRIESYQRGIYLVTLVAAACAAITLIAPVAVHRMLFRRHQKHELVVVTSRLSAAGLVFLAIAILSAVLLVVDIVVNLTFAIAMVVVLGALLVGLWYALPIEVRRRRPSRDLRP
jgi:O-antigen/teichoic acid export membrane protein